MSGILLNEDSNPRDWALNATMPDTVSLPMITINGPLGVQTIENPLYNYTFHPQPSAADFPPSDTVRCFFSFCIE